MMKSTTDEIKEFKDKVDEINHVRNLLEFYWDYVRERIGVPIESQHYIKDKVNCLIKEFSEECNLKDGEWKQYNAAGSGWYCFGIAEECDYEGFVDDLSEYFGVEFKYAAGWAGHGYNWYKWKLEGCPY